MIKADLKCSSVAAASVLAKVERDAMMVALAAGLPGLRAGSSTRATPRPSTWPRCAGTGRASTTAGRGGCPGCTLEDAEAEVLA